MSGSLTGLNRPSRLFGLLREEGDQVVSVLVLLETAKGHLGAGNVLLGVLKVLELVDGQGCRDTIAAYSTYQSVVVPLDALLLVGVGV
jgi:hypothetical protein